MIFLNGPFKSITKLLEILVSLLETIVKIVETLRKTIEKKLTTQTVNQLAILVVSAIVIFTSQALLVVLYSYFIGQ